MCARSSGEVKGHGRDRFEKGLPSLDVAHGDLAGGEQSPQDHGHGVGAGQHGLGLDPAAERLVQTLYRIRLARDRPVQRIDAGEGEEAIPRLLHAYRRQRGA